MHGVRIFVLYDNSKNLYKTRMADDSPSSLFLRRCRIPEVFSLFDFLPELILFVKDRDGRFMALNQRACECCGVREEQEALGKTEHDFFPKTWADQSARDDAEVLSSGRPLVNRLEGAPHCEWSRRLVSTTKVPLRDDVGRTIGLVSFARLLEEACEQPVHSRRMAKVVQRMSEDLSSDIKTQELARLAGLSVSQFDRCFHAAFGTSAHHYHLRLRIDEACRLLARTDEKVAAIALACGFYDHAHFGRVFQREMKMSPMRYRQTHQLARKDQGTRAKSRR